MALNKEQANKLLEYTENYQAQVQEEQKLKLEEYSDSLRAETESDPEIGGKYLTDNVNYAKKAINEFGGKEVFDVLIQTGLANSKHVIKMFSQIGRKLERANLQIGDNETQSVQKTKEPKSFADRLYPD